MRPVAFVVLLVLAALAGCTKDPPAAFDLVVVEARGASEIVVELANVGGSAAEVSSSNFRLLAANGAVAVDNTHTLGDRADRFPQAATLDAGATLRGTLSFVFVEDETRPWTVIYKVGAARVDAIVP